MGEAKSAFGDRDVRSTADNLVMVSKRYTTETAKREFDGCNLYDDFALVHWTLKADFHSGK